MYIMTYFVQSGLFVRQDLAVTESAATLAVVVVDEDQRLVALQQVPRFTCKY